MGTAWFDSAGRGLPVPCWHLTPVLGCGQQRVRWELRTPEFTSASPCPCPYTADTARARGAGTRPASSCRESGWHRLVRARQSRAAAMGQDPALSPQQGFSPSLQPIAGFSCVPPAGAEPGRDGVGYPQP